MVNFVLMQEEEGVRYAYAAKSSSSLNVHFGSLTRCGRSFIFSSFLA